MASAPRHGTLGLWPSRKGSGFLVRRSLVRVQPVPIGPWAVSRSEPRLPWNRTAIWTSGGSPRGRATICNRIARQALECEASHRLTSVPRSRAGLFESKGETMSEKKESVSGAAREAKLALLKAIKGIADKTADNSNSMNVSQFAMAASSLGSALKSVEEVKV